MIPSAMKEDWLEMTQAFAFLWASRHWEERAVPYKVVDALSEHFAKPFLWDGKLKRMKYLHFSPRKSIEHQNDKKRLHEVPFTPLILLFDFLFLRGRMRCCWLQHQHHIMYRGRFPFLTLVSQFDRGFICQTSAEIWCSVWLRCLCDKELRKSFWI